MNDPKKTQNEFIQRFIEGDDSRTPMHASQINQLVDYINWLTGLLKNMKGKNGVTVKVSDANIVVSGTGKSTGEDDPNSTTSTSTQTSSSGSVINNTYCVARYA